MSGQVSELAAYCAPPNGSRLSCGRNAGKRKVMEWPRTFAGETTQFFLTCERPAASSGAGDDAGEESIAAPSEVSGIQCASRRKTGHWEPNAKQAGPALQLRVSARNLSTIHQAIQPRCERFR